MRSGIAGIRLLSGAMVLGLLAAAVPWRAYSQTPSPLQEWQYSRGWALVRIFDIQQPDLLVLTGAAIESAPLSDGSAYYRTRGGPVFEIRYHDEFFFSLGEGLGANLLQSEHYTLGVSLTYDLGRQTDGDSLRLRGLPDIPAAPVARVFGSYVVSRKFPLVLRSDVRKFIGGAAGVVANFGAYIPLPGSSSSTFIFAGPGATWADHTHMDRAFGVTEAESLASGYPSFEPRAGVDAVGFGLSASHIISSRWILNLDAAINRLGAGAAQSPLAWQRTQHVITASVLYRW